MSVLLLLKGSYDGRTLGSGYVGTTGGGVGEVIDNMYVIAGSRDLRDSKIVNELLLSQDFPEMVGSARILFRHSRPLLMCVWE